LIYLILEMIVYLPVCHSHCTRSRFTVPVSCSEELEFHSCPPLCLQRQVPKLAIGMFRCWVLLRKKNKAANLQRFTSSYGSRRFAANHWWTQTSWQVIQRDRDCW